MSRGAPRARADRRGRAGGGGARRGASRGGTGTSRPFRGYAAPMPSTSVVVETDHGNIEIALEDDKAPKSVANFLSYVDEKHYDGTIFHRVIPGFMAQGGG